MVKDGVVGSQGTVTGDPRELNPKIGELLATVGRRGRVALMGSRRLGFLFLLFVLVHSRIDDD